MERHRLTLVGFGTAKTGTFRMSTNDRDQDRVWDLIEKIAMPMLANWDGTKLHSRPMSAYSDRKAQVIYFLFDARQHKEEELSAFPQVNLAFADTSGQKYVSVSGKAEVLNDRMKIKELFSTPAKAWWQSPDDPNIRILRVIPEEGQFWDAPGTVASYIKIAFAAVTGTLPEIGDNAKVAM